MASSLSRNGQPSYRLGITLGDPSGIGPEVVRAAMLKYPSAHIEVVREVGTFKLGAASRQSAQAAWDSLETAAEKLRNGEWQGVVTGPVCKRTLHEIGFPFPGQTEFFAARAGIENFAMCLTGGNLTVALVTAHLPLRQVVISRSEVVRVGLLLASFLQRRGCSRIAVAGLNPHAGEGGDLGREEIEVISPAVSDLQATGTATFSGPFSADTIFCRAIAGEFDGVLCMYHDQGLIPLKVHAFDAGVNVTLGLPFVRTSPDHGTAFDIAGRNVARPDSMLSALRLADELCAMA